MDPKNVLLLTGASGGLGLELAEHFLSSGHRNLAFQYRSHSEKITSVLKKFDLSPESHLFKADLTNEDDVRNMREGVEKKIGPVNHLLNLAGCSSNSVSWKLSLADFQNVVNGNLTSTFLSCREFIPSMREKNYGRIVNISSVIAFTGMAGTSHYCAAKSGIVGFTKALALELASKKITANTLALGYFNRGLIDSVPLPIQEQIKGKIPAGRFGTTPEIFGALDYLFSDKGSYVTGQVMHINGGLYL